ncbi:MAG: hypothetical protein QGH33_05620 [Pirellulaceae bacterium]|jgi:hypothetical protein|nr:hypothetical protein [Pirellulaceae bacterium]HJN07610.1 hypothetical protein [Pirellulaceae bacterium]
MPTSRQADNVARLSQPLTSRLVIQAIGQQPKATGETPRSVLPKRRRATKLSICVPWEEVVESWELCATAPEWATTISLAGSASPWRVTAFRLQWERGQSD